MAPNRVAARRVCFRAMMLIPAAISAAPVKYAQNRRHGIHDGTILATPLPWVRCITPKNTIGRASRNSPSRLSCFPVLSWFVQKAKFTIDPLLLLRNLIGLSAERGHCEGF